MNTSSTTTRVGRLSEAERIQNAINEWIAAPAKTGKFSILGISGYGGVGKSYLLNSVLSEQRLETRDVIAVIQRVWYYAVIQINETLAGRLRQMKWAPLFSTGKVFYQDFETRRPDGVIVPTPTFVLSFDAIIGDAESRNHTFLEILKSGMRALVKAESFDAEAPDIPETTAVAAFPSL